MKDASLMPVWVQLATVIGTPLVTYLGIVYKERSSLKKIADDTVAKTLSGQENKIDKMDDKVEELSKKVDDLTGAYRKIRNSLVVIQAQAESIRIRLATYLDLLETAPEKAKEQLLKVEQGFDDLFNNIDSLLEETDPIEGKARQPERQKTDSGRFIDDDTLDMKKQLEDLSEENKS